MCVCECVCGVGLGRVCVCVMSVCVCGGAAAVVGDQVWQCVKLNWCNSKKPKTRQTKLARPHRAADRARGHHISVAVSHFPVRADGVWVGFTQALVLVAAAPYHTAARWPRQAAIYPAVAPFLVIFYLPGFTSVMLALEEDELCCGGLVFKF